MNKEKILGDYFRTLIALEAYKEGEYMPLVVGMHFYIVDLGINFNPLRAKENPWAIDLPLPKGWTRTSILDELERFNMLLTHGEEEIGGINCAIMAYIGRCAVEAAPDLFVPMETLPPDERDYHGPLEVAFDINEAMGLDIWFHTLQIFSDWENRLEYLIVLKKRIAGQMRKHAIQKLVRESVLKYVEEAQDDL